jgi:hypothetical protein
MKTEILSLFPEEEDPTKPTPQRLSVSEEEKRMSPTEFAAYLEKQRGKPKIKGPSEARLEETSLL